MALLKFFNPRENIEKTHHNLPHWQQGEVPVFVTFRLADSLPREVLEAWQRERESFHDAHPPPWDEITEACYHGLFSERLDEHLDSGSGCCALRDRQIAQVVVDRLHHFDGQRYRLWSYVLMPNHAHVLFTLGEAEALADTLQGWKGVSSRFIHKQGLCTLNPFWQADYFDRLIRSPEHFAMVKAYIRENPAKARLHSGYVLWERQG
jgi:REP element-mobilizing transposase RayT